MATAKNKRKGKFTSTYRGTKGEGKYQIDYDRLVALVPKNGKRKAPTIAGEIMRAVTKMNEDFYTNGALDDSLDAINFLSMAGIFDGNTDALATIFSLCLHGAKAYVGKYSGDEVQLAVERTIDRSIEFLLLYPDLEYAENETDMSTLLGEVDFVERTLAKNATAAAPIESIMNIRTPRIANKAS